MSEHPLPAPPCKPFTIQVDGIWTADAKKALALQSQLNYLNKKLSVYEDLHTTASEMTELAGMFTPCATWTA